MQAIVLYEESVIKLFFFIIDVDKKLIKDLSAYLEVHMTRAQDK